MSSFTNIESGVGSSVESVDITDGTIVNADVSASAAIDGTKINEATTSARGTTEAAIASEVNTGTDAVRFVSPDSLAGSNLGTKSLIWRVVASDTALSATDGVDTILIPSSLNGMNLVRATAFVDTAGTTNATTVDIYNVTGTADMLTGAISIASGDTVATAGTIDTANDDVSTDDKIRCDVTTVSTTPPSGLTVVLEFRLP